MQVIIFPNENGGVSVITPTPEYADQVEAVARKDVPFQKEWVSTGKQWFSSNAPDGSEVMQEMETGYFRETVQVWRIIDHTELPSYDLRSQWRWTDEGPLGLQE